MSDAPQSQIENTLLVRNTISYSRIRLPLEHVLHNEPYIGRSFGQTPHKVRIPLFTVRNIHSHVVTVTCKLLLQVTTHTIEHLKLECTLLYLFFCSVRNG